MLAVSAWARNASVDYAVLIPAKNDAREVSVSDTLFFSVEAGRPFITVLPDRVGGVPVEKYENLRVPARSWRHHRAFFWQTVPGDSGKHTILVGTQNAGRIRDTLIVIVDVLR